MSKEAVEAIKKWKEICMSYGPDFLNEGGFVKGSYVKGSYVKGLVNKQ